MNATHRLKARQRVGTRPRIPPKDHDAGLGSLLGSIMSNYDLLRGSNAIYSQRCGGGRRIIRKSIGSSN